MTNSLDIIKKHLCSEVPLVLKNSDGTEDTIMLKPLDTGQQAVLFQISKKMESIGDKNLDEETMIKVFDLYKGIIKKAIPEIDSDTLDNFVVTNFEVLAETLEKLVPKSEDKTKIDTLTKRLEQRKAQIDG
jgi:hypothetical protein